MSDINAQDDHDLISLEPTVEINLADHLAGTRGPLTHANPLVAMMSGTMSSFGNESDILRRQRLLGASVFLAVAFGLLSSWIFASDNPATLTVDGSAFSLRFGLIAVRCLLAAVVAGLLASEAPLSKKMLRGVELVLFFGLAVLMLFSQYFVGLDLMRRGAEYTPVILAFIKDGVIQMLVLMMIYGMLIPNAPAVAAKTLLAMFAGVFITVYLIRSHPEVGPVISKLGEAEEAGSNLLFLGIGTALSIYGAYLVNGLRTELHQAKKFGQYRLVRKLGEGGMGEVYLAEHALLKRPCALKLIKAAAGTDALALARFEREVQSSARLAHHNTIEIYDYGHTDDGTFYYVMEYLNGMSLEELIRKHGALPAGRVIFLFRQVCAGLAEAHHLGLVHRDLKPANVYVAQIGGESDVAKVLDFGLVKVTKEPDAVELTADMRVSGTPLYMAPEQTTGDKTLDARADIYALGVMMYHALTGRLPFSGNSAIEVMIAHARDLPLPPSQIKADVPQDLEKVVMTCLAKKPEDRYQKVGQLNQALRSCQAAHDWSFENAADWWASQDQPGIVETPLPLIADNDQTQHV
jgi:serine/threonine-protein kinase